VCCDCGRVRPADRRGAVELHVKLTTLARLNDDPALIPGFGPVIADIARQVAHDQALNPVWKWSVTDEDGMLLHHGHTQRRPTPTEKAFVIARDQLCRTPGCRRPAKACDLDHRHEHAKHGPSHRGNLEPACPRDHALRDIPGYQVTLIRPGLTEWRTPNGRAYYLTPDAVLRLTADLDNPHPSLYRPQPPPTYIGVETEDTAHGYGDDRDMNNDPEALRYTHHAA
jgi:hypothetical protein